MKCPVCNIDLKLAERQGIEIDYCSQCRGVWLDRGELDKIIERASAQHGTTRGHENSHFRPSVERKPEHYHEKRKKSLLSELFDFD
jgi:hypothetical protein